MGHFSQARFFYNNAGKHNFNKFQFNFFIFTHLCEQSALALVLTQINNNTNLSFVNRAESILIS